MDISNILVVDDNKINLTIISKVLQNEHFNIITFDSGRKAIDYIHKNRDVSLILMDVQMPGLNGFETVEIIKQDEELADIPILFVTALFKENDDVEHGYALGAYDYILKPFEPNVLKNKVNIFLTLYNQKKLLKKQSLEANLQKEFLSKVFASIPSILIVIDSNYNIITQNETLEITLKKYPSLEVNDIINFLKNDLDEIISTDRVIAHEINFSINSKNICFDVVLTRLHETESDNKILITLTDKTEQKEIELEKDRINKLREKAEEALFMEKEELSVSLSSISDGVMTIHKDGTIILANTAAENILGYQTSELHGKSIYETIQFISDDNKIINFNPLDYIDTNDNLKPKLNQFTIVLSDEKKKIISSNVSELQDPNGNLTGMVIVIRDITERVRIENQLSLSQKMESVGQLASGIAHEINTPMQFVGDNTFFLKDAFVSLMSFIKDINNLLLTDEKSESDINEIIDYIKVKAKELDIEYLSEEVPIAIDRTLNGIERVSKIVHAMKNFAHPSTKQRSLTNLNQGIEVTSTISRNEWKYVTELELKLDKNLPFVNCLIDEINQVILNMIINATHAIESKYGKNSAEKGKIIIETSFDEQFVQIKISDTGAGISKENLNRIYDPFFTTKEVGKGTGQGLAIAHDIIVNKHKGAINVESIQGEGTTFYIKLPIA